MNPAASVLSLTKGLEPGTLKRFSEVLAEELPQPAASRVLVLSGPNHAEEVARDVPTATTIASRDLELARQVQQVIATSNFRVYINADLLGVELCAATKNVIALAAGMADGLGYGDNTKAALMTRGLAEMVRLGKKLGASAETFYGLAGMGDLVATCTSRHSRNRAAGELIAQGRSAVEAEAELGMVAEGLTSAGALRDLARQEGVEMPITEQVCEVIYEGKDVERAVIELMARAAPRGVDGAARPHRRPLSDRRQQPGLPRLLCAAGDDRHQRRVPHQRPAGILHDDGEDPGRLPSLRGRRRLGRR